MVMDSTYSIIHTAAAAVALGTVAVFIGTYLRQLRQLRRYRGPLRLASIVAALVALCALLLVTSPLDYRSSAPAPAGLKLYVLSTSNDLFTLRASDGAQTLVRHLPGLQLQMRYYENGLLILADPDHEVSAPTATAGTTGTAETAGAAADTSAAASSQVYAYTLQAVRGDNGQAALPALGTLSNVTADSLDHGTLYVTALADPAHPDAETLSAFSLQAGALLWQQALPTLAPTANPPQFCGSDGGAVYVLLGTSVVAVQIGDGAVLWRSAPLWQSSASPQTAAQRCVAQDGGVYVEVGSAGGGEPRVLIKLSEGDGTQRWNAPVGSLISVAGDRLYATNTTTELPGPRLVVLRASDGAQLGAPLEVAIDGLQAPYSATSAGVLYVVGFPTTGLQRFAFDPCEIFAIRLSDGVRLWQHPPHACDSPIMLRVAGDSLYYSTNYGDFTAFRIADGVVLWTHTGYHTGGEFFHWSDTFAIGGFSSGVLFVATSHEARCQLLVVGCDPDNGQYLEVLNPTNGVLYWRYRTDQIAGYYLLSA